MKQAIKVRVLIDTNEEVDVFRDIEILGDKTFEDLHNYIQDVFEFDKSQMASFYESNDSWDHGDEISLMDMQMGKDQKEIRLMSNTILSDVIDHPGQKILYVFDFLLMWTFFVEVIQIADVEEGAEYPRITLQYGDSPDQYSKEPEDLFGAMGADFGDFNPNDENLGEEDAENGQTPDFY